MKGEKISAQRLFLNTEMFLYNIYVHMGEDVYLKFRCASIEMKKKFIRISVPHFLQSEDYTNGKVWANLENIYYNFYSTFFFYKNKSGMV